MARLRSISPSNSTSISQSPINWPLTLRKLGLSTLVVGGFVVYAVQDHSSLSVAPTPVDPSSAALNQQPAITTPLPSRTPRSAIANGSVAVVLKDGTYTGQSVDAYYGYVQVKATVQGGHVTDVQFVDYPHDRRTSQEINQQAMPMLTGEAIQVQNAQVDSISGATFTSEGFVQSLQSALQQAQS